MMVHNDGIFLIDRIYNDVQGNLMWVLTTDNSTFREILSNYHPNLYFKNLSNLLSTPTCGQIS